MPKEDTQWKKGQSGNPLGKPKGIINSKTILERFLSIQKEMVNPLNDELESMSIAELMHLKQIANAMQGDLAAYKEIIDRLEGKTTNKIDIDADVKSTNYNIDLSKDEIKNISDQLDKDV